MGVAVIIVEGATDEADLANEADNAGMSGESLARRGIGWFAELRFDVRLLLPHEIDQPLIRPIRLICRPFDIDVR